MASESSRTVGPGATRFTRGDELFGQLLIAPIGSAGTYAEYVAVTEDAPLARVPDGMDAGARGGGPDGRRRGARPCSTCSSRSSGKTVLIVGAGGGIGSFAIQFAANAGAHVIANVREDAAERMRGYGADGNRRSHQGLARRTPCDAAHPDGIDVLIDVVSDAEGFAALASLVRPGGTAVTTQYVADPGALAAAGVTGINFALHESSELLERVADAPRCRAHRRAADPPHRAGGSARRLEAAAVGPRRRQDGHHVVSLP